MQDQQTPKIPQPTTTPEPIQSPSDPAQSPVIVPMPKSKPQGRLRRLLKNKKFWFITALILLAILIAAWFIQPSRIWLVNAVGAKTTLTITAMTPNEGKQKAAKLKNAQVLVNGRAYKTNAKGELYIADQPYGPVQVVAKKQGYAEASYNAVLDFDPFFQRLGNKAAHQADQDARNIQLQLRAVGVPVSFKAVDWLNGLPLKTGTYTVGDIIVQPDEQGVVSFRAPSSDTQKVSISSNLGLDYMNRTFELQLGASKQSTIEFVPSGKHYFLSREGGALSVVGSNLDGTEKQIIIPGTGQESLDTMLAISPSGRYGVLVSTRDGARDKQNQLLRRLYIVNLQSKQLTKVDEGSGFQLYDWADDKLVYTRLGSLVDNPESEEPQAALRFADAASNKATDITAAYKINRVIVGFSQVAFVQTTQVSQESANTTSDVRLYNFKTSNTKNLGYGALVLRQLSQDRIAFQALADQKWHEYNLNTSQEREIAQPNESPYITYIGSPSPDNARRLYVDRIDGRFTLFSRATVNNADKQLFADGRMVGPVRWLNSTVVTFRIVSSSETADYAVSILGGQPRKITNVTASESAQGATVDINLLRQY